MIEKRIKKDFKSIAEVTAILDTLEEGKEYTLIIKEYREKRSLDANAYFWVLLDKLAEKCKLPKIDLYRELIKNIGGNNQVVCVPEKAVEKLIKGWEHNGIGWTAEVTTSKLENCKNVILYYGSSTYDTAQMSRLIDLVVQECKQQEIETMTPQELERLCIEWTA